MVLGKQSLLLGAQKEKMNEIGNLPRVILFSLSTSFGLPPILNCPKNYMGAMYSDIRYTFLPVVSTREVAINQILGGQKGKKIIVMPDGKSTVPRHEDAILFLPSQQLPRLRPLKCFLS